MKIVTDEAIPVPSHRLGSSHRTIAVTAFAIGTIFLGLSVLMGDREQFLRSYLTCFGFFLSISLGALFFVLLQHLTGAGWSVVVRRLAEAIASYVVLLVLLFFPVLALLGNVYGWVTPPEGDHLLHGKQGWLNPAFFTFRVLVYFAVWIVIARWFMKTSVRQDETGDKQLTLLMQARSPVAMILYGFTVTFAAFDLFMSLDPHWFSTMYGVYYFSGGMVGFFAFLAVLVYLLQGAGKLVKEITEEHWHDIGKQLFGWNVFWAYIAFSQYMLIWYANIPEETHWYWIRQQGGWLRVGLVLLIGHFAIPFVLMLPRVMKRTPVVVATMGVWLLVMHWVDMYYLVAPHGADGVIHFNGLDVIGFVGHLALFLGGLFYVLGQGSLIPKRDPRLPESLAFENI